MKLFIYVPMCRQRRAKEGFFLLVNGQRIFFKRRADAVAAAQDLLKLQKMQIVTVRSYAARLPKSRSTMPAHWELCERH